MEIFFDCIFYYVSDLDLAIDFYTEVLGLSLTSKDVIARFDVDGILFELIPTTDQKKLDGEGNARLCLGSNDIYEVMKELNNMGVATSDVESVENGLLCFFKDPDGNEICVWQSTA